MIRNTDLLLMGWRHNLEKAEELFAVIPANQMTRQPAGLVNHPAWALAHLNHYHAPLLDLARGHDIHDPGELPGADRYDAGSSPVDDPDLYPDKDALLEAYRAGHERVVVALQSATPEQLSQPPKLDRWAPWFNSSAEALSYLMVYHEATHLGEVMAWRRAMGAAPLE